MTTEMQSLAAQSVKQGLSPKELIQLYKEHGFKKNGRGKPWTVNAVYQHQVRVRKAQSAEVAELTPSKTGVERKADMISQIIAHGDMTAEQKMSLIEDIYSGRIENLRTVVTNETHDTFSIRIEDVLLERGYLVELTRKDAKDLLTLVDKIQAFADGNN